MTQMQRSFELIMKARNIQDIERLSHQVEIPASTLRSWSRESFVPPYARIKDLEIKLQLDEQERLMLMNACHLLLIKRWKEA